MKPPLTPRYRPLPGRHDLAVDAAGRPRTGWHQVLAGLDRAGVAELARHQQSAIHRGWPGSNGRDDAAAVPAVQLDVVPMVVPDESWDGLAQGLVQRAELLQAVLADLHGPRELLRAGIVPIEALWWLHAAVWRATTAPQLTCMGADLVADGSGRWLVVRDLSDVPDADAWAALTRATLGHSLPEHPGLDAGPVGNGGDATTHDGEVEVLDLAPFLRALRARLDAAGPHRAASPRTILLTPPPGHPDYEANVHLGARLGYDVVDPAAVVVRGDRAWLHSIAGLEPVDALLRRVPQADLDPVESRQAIGLGVPGLVEAARSHAPGSGVPGAGVVVANPYGAATVDGVALHPFLDDACRHLLGQPLLLPNVEALWCGDPDQLAEVLAAPADFVIHHTDPVLPDGLDPIAGPVTEAQLDDWLAHVAARPERYVAQRRVAQATTPSLTGDQLVPSPCALRTQVLLGDGGTHTSPSLVMPGAKGRAVAPTPPATTDGPAPDRGVLVKDVWVLGTPRRPHQRITSAASATSPAANVVPPTSAPAPSDASGG